MASPQSPRTESEAQENTPETPSSLAPPGTPISATAGSASSLQVSDASKLSSRRGKITQIACVACRQRKSKCDGARPICQACQTRPNTQCVYDVTLDQRKPSSLRQRVGELEQEVGNFRDILELLLNALPERLRPRFQGFVEHVDELGLSNELLDDARSRLNKPPSPDNDDQMQEVAQQMDNSSSKFNVESNTGNTQLGNAQGSGQNNPYLFDYGSSISGQGQRDSGNVYEDQGGIGLAMPMPVDNSGMGTSFWRLQNVQQPAWAPMNRKQEDHGRAMTQPMAPSTNHDWSISAGNSMRTLSLYGKLDTGDPSSGQPIDLNTALPIHVVHPLNEDDGRPLSGMYSGVYVGYRDLKRQQIRNGVNVADILGPTELNFRAAVDPTSFHNDLPLSSWAAELFGAHRNLRPSDRVACAWMVTTLMRWQISPTRENYERVPPWLRPTPKQCFVPHAANLEYLPWPELRDALISMKQSEAEVTVNNLSVNWPYSDGEILFVDQSRDTLALNPAFSNHIASLDSWSMGASLLSILPSINGLAKFDNDR